jgi:hypothetical protein
MFVPTIDAAIALWQFADDFDPFVPETAGAWNRAGRSPGSGQHTHLHEEGIRAAARAVVVQENA